MVLVVVVVAGLVEDGAGACVVVTSSVVDDAVGSVATAPDEQPAINAHMTIAVRRAGIVSQPVTGDLPWRVMKRLAGVVVGVTMLAAACNVDEGATSTQTLPPLGTPSNTIPPTTAITVAITEVAPAAATSTIALPAGTCVFSPPAGTAEVTFEIGTRLYGVNPASGASSCLTELTLDNVGPFQWSPTGDRVLLNAATVFDGTQALPSGYFT
ncbi:MAG: hypothetical protein QOJ08_1255, partial [Ilumatobacteraceae bacterium]